MSVYSELVRRFAAELTGRAAARAVHQLSRMPGGLSGDDSGLRTAWQEFCVQVQGEESFFWEEYQETVKQVAHGVVSRLTRLESTAIWLQSDEAIDWMVEHEEGSELPPVSEADVVEVVYSAIWRLADRSRSSPVVRYLARAQEID